MIVHIESEQNNGHIHSESITKVTPENIGNVIFDMLIDHPKSINVRSMSVSEYGQEMLDIGYNKAMNEFYSESSSDEQDNESISGPAAIESYDVENEEEIELSIEQVFDADDIWDILKRVDKLEKLTRTLIKDGEAPCT